MNDVLLAAFGWLVPGGSYLLMRRYFHFAAFALLVSVTFAFGLALHGAYQWPTAAELHGLDGMTALLFQAGSFAKLLAGAPYLLGALLGGPTTFLDGRVHEYGTMLLSLAGVFNLLAISNAFDLRKAESR